MSNMVTFLLMHRECFFLVNDTESGDGIFFVGLPVKVEDVF